LVLRREVYKYDLGRHPAGWEAKAGWKGGAEGRFCGQLKRGLVGTGAVAVGEVEEVLAGGGGGDPACISLNSAVENLLEWRNALLL
jgi:hypothetical protein